MAIKLISFDLDDTLWPCMGTIHRAEEIVHHWLLTHHPTIAKQYTIKQLGLKRDTLKQQYLHLSHNISAVRRLSLFELAKEFAYSPEQTQQFVADAFALYYQARNNVTLYGDVLPVLSQLHRTFRLVSITNGNADIYQTPTDLAKVMEFSWSAAQAGVEKPHPKIFYDIIKKAGIAKDEMIHVGDDPVSDIFGAHIAGIRSIWINREQQPWPKYIKPAHFTICSLNEINHLDIWS